ncbi:MAG: hypothetical protein QM764_12790 [Chitinophagaceae bacterium]
MTAQRDSIDLRNTATNAIISILPISIERRTFIINDIPKNTFLTTNERLITVALSDILLNTVSSGNNSCIRVFAKKEYDELRIVIIDNHSDYSRYISGKMTKIQPIIKKLGGQLQFEFNQRENITVILSFTYK